MQRSRIEDIVVEAIRNANLAREPTRQLEASASAAIYGPGSALDSLGLVGLIIDIEESLHSAGSSVSLSDERAMSQTRSPFRDVPALVAFIGERLEQQGPRT